MAQQWALIGNIVIACAYFAISMAIMVPVVRAGQTLTNRLAVATGLIFFSCGVGHALHAAVYWQAIFDTGAMPGMHDAAGWSLWPIAAWDMFTAAVGVYYWTLRRGYGILLGAGLFEDPQELQRRHDIEVRERVAEGRAQAEAERDAQAAMLRAVISNSQSLIYVKDLEGHYLLANETFQAAFGVTADELIGQTDDYLDADSAPAWRANDLLARNGRIHREEIALHDGERRVYESNKFPLYDTTGGLYAICGVSLDVTDLRTAAEAAEQARDEALAQSAIKSDFLATMSHEIRTPMNGVLGLASLLTATNLDTAQRRYATGIHNAGTALLGVINDILDFSKLEAGKVILDPDDFDLPNLLAETATLIAPTAAEKGLTVVTEPGPQLPATVRGDGGRVRQILLNLAGNAVKFTGTGGITLRADQRPGKPGGDALVVRFEVQDTGIGIARADAERLFQPFTQADASTTRTYGGTGLGLAISRQLTEAMGGTIGVDSEPGQGSTFWCEIPFETPTGTGSSTAPDSAGLRILLAGTGPDRPYLEDDLRRWQMTVTSADTAALALDALRDAAGRGRPFDLLLLDADPGDVDTAGLARLVTADDTIPAVQIIVLNDDAPADNTAGRTHLPKPVHRSALYDLLAKSMAAVVPVPVTPAATPMARPARRGTVLLVEDNDINQMVATGLLTGLGYEIDVAGDGVQALEMAGAREYDTILMDCRMPRMDGFTATAELRRRESESGGRVPIIATTASALVADRERCLAAGMDDYLAKPVNLAELEAMLDRWVGSGGPGPGPGQGPGPGGVGRAAAAAGGGASSGTASSGVASSGVVSSGAVSSAVVSSGAMSSGAAASGVVSSGSGGAERDAGGDPIGARLDELAGERSEPELALIERLVTSFLARSPLLLDELTEAFDAGDVQGVEDNAHTLKGAAGNIGAGTVVATCGRLEDDARSGTLNPGTAAAMQRLHVELAEVEHRLREVLKVKP